MKLRKKLAATLGVTLAACGMTITVAAPQAHAASTFYVSPSGNNSDGSSWADAWTDTANINWGSVPSGSTIILDGGTSTCGVSPYDFGTSNNPGVNCGTTYSTLTIGQDNVTIERSTAAGHNGTVVLDGGRNTPLPYCEQPTYSAPTGAAQVIDLNGHSGVTINGMTRSGIDVRGGQEGVEMRSGSGNTLENMEIFDNGFPESESFGYTTDGNGVEVGGDDTYKYLLVHDNGQDEFHSDSHGYSEAGSSFIGDWMGAMRADPTYPGEPFNDIQATGNDPGCEHADGIQIFSPGTTMNGLTLDHDVFGPGVNQGLYPSDAGTGTLFNNVSVTNSLFLDTASHNIEVDHPGVSGWTLDHDTIYATQGGFEIPGNSGTNTMTNTIKDGGYVYVPDGSWTTSGNDWWTGDPLPNSNNANVNPNFTNAPTGNLPSLASLRAANLTPNNCSQCAGSPLHSLSDLLSYIDAQNGGGTCTIGEDSSSPSTTTSSGNTSGVITSPSFSPPANTMLEVTVGAGFHSSGNTAAETISDSKGGTWTQGAFESDGRYDANGIWYRYLSSAPGSMTVTATDSNHAQAGYSLAVRVLTGVASSQAGAASVAYASPNNTSTSMTDSITTTETGSRVYLAAGGNNGTTTGNSATNTLNSFVDNTDGETLVVGRNVNNTGTPGSETLGWTNSKSGYYTWVGQEFLPATTC